MNDKPEAVILMGLPLAGKSTWIEDNNEFNYKVISADDIKINHPLYDPKHTEKLHQYSVEKARELLYSTMENKENFIFDSGSINTNYTIDIINVLVKNNYFIVLVHIKTPYTICLERNKIRERQVPEHSIFDKAICEKAQFHKLKKLVNEKLVVDYFTNKHIFIDMDGVIAALSTLPIINGEIDFVNGEVHKYLEPVEVIISKLKNICQSGKAELYILSAIPNSFSYNEKNLWLDKHFDIPKEKRFFVNQGKHKAEMLENLSTKLKLNKQDILMLDDIHATLYDIQARGMNCMHVSEFLTHKF